MKRLPGIMRDVHVGNRDAPWPCIWFTLIPFPSEATYGQALAILPLSSSEADRLIGSVYDITELEGKPIWIDGSKTGMLQFIERAEI